MFELNEAVRSRLIGSKSWNRNVRIFFSHSCGPWQRTAVWVRNCVNCEINHVLVCMRPEMAVKPEFTK